jgi:tetratricopeptide (TPR) repeat protein
MRGVSLNAATECPGLMSELVKRASQWDSIEASLGGRTALSLRRRADLFRALGNPEVSARAKAHGVVFVSPRVSELIRTAGFCAIETHDLEAAERFIKQLIAIDPTDERAAGELAHVYVSEKRWDAALAQIEHALKTTVDPCNQAILWRKKGYVFTEQRSLTEARRAYLRSLELDPGNDLAVNELRLLGRLAGNSGGSEPPTSMPPSTSSTTSGCRAQ